MVNNDYASGWGMYAIGGSEAPTILSEGNRFLANGPKEVRRVLPLTSLRSIFLEPSVPSSEGALLLLAVIVCHILECSSPPHDLMLVAVAIPLIDTPVTLADYEEGGRWW